MKDKDYAILNYYLTLLRGLIIKRLNDNFYTDDIKEDYAKIINYINEIMKYHIFEGSEE